MVDRFLPLFDIAKPFLSDSELDYWFALIDAQNSPSTKVWEREETNDFLKRFITDIEREEYKHRNSLSEWKDQLLNSVQIVQKKYSECDNDFYIYTYNFSDSEKKELKKSGIKYEGLSPRLLHIAPFMLAYCEGLFAQKTKEENTLEMKALREQQRQRHWETTSRFIFGNTQGLSVSATDEQSNPIIIEEISKSVLIPEPIMEMLV